MLSLIVPVYRNEGSIPQLIEALDYLDSQMNGDFEAVLVVDGSPDRSLELLSELLSQARFRSQLLSLSRNFGSFSAIRAGLAQGEGELFAVMAADLQEPPELILNFREKLLSGQFDVVVGTRSGRNDPIRSRIASKIFWASYRLLVQSDVPPGGVDVFACTRDFKDQILALGEHNSTLVGLIFWLGFRRAEVSYSRRLRQHGKSGWSFSRRIRYLLDSTFAFSDLPIRMLSLAGVAGMMLSVLLSITVVLSKFFGSIAVPGYAATVLVIMFFGGLNSLGLGLIGEYLWRTFENTKNRSLYIVSQHRVFKPTTK